MSEARRLATYDDLRRLPDTMIGEIIGGKLYASPRPAPRHAAASSAIGVDLGAEYGRRRGGRGGWWLLDEPELHLGPDVLVPDIAGWRRERMPRLPTEAAFTLAPDWVCEVLSPSTASLDRYRKLPVYARAGVGHAWLVDPALRAVEVYRLEGEHWVLLASHAGDEPFHAEPFAEVELDPTEWWADAEEGAETPPGT
ncbi:MAG: Uma2 family endonuclease [Pseudomonadota bacterium]|nr:Uma2 family endonuclease [Pseudomonadota bacterium]